MTATISALKHGDFTGLADNYAKHRPAYAESVLTCILALAPQPISDIDFVDVGAGTGIWTRMVARQGIRSVIAVEPNDDMRAAGEAGNKTLSIRWQAGKGDATGLADASCDLASMASSFHWVDFEAGLREFHRILRPGGCFVALWNPRLIEVNPLLVEIEDKLYELAPHIERVSSGRAAFTDKLTDRILANGLFEDVVYLEGRHTAHLTPQQYFGVWQSVNDIQVQAGSEVFSEFLAFVENRTRTLKSIEATYQTRAWVMRKV